MLVITNKRYVKKHQVGGSGIFDSISGILRSIAASEVRKTAISAGKTVAKEFVKSAASEVKKRIKQLIDNTSSKPAITQKE